MSSILHKDFPQTMRFEAVQLSPMQCVKFKEVLALQKFERTNTNYAHAVTEMAVKLKGIKQLNENVIKVKISPFNGYKVGRRAAQYKPIFAWQNKEAPANNSIKNKGFIDISKAEKKFGGRRFFYDEFARQILGSSPANATGSISVQIVDDSETIDYGVISDFNIVPISEMDIKSEPPVTVEVTNNNNIEVDDLDGILADKIMLLQILDEDGFEEAIDTAVTKEEKQYVTEFKNNKDLENEIKKLEMQRITLNSFKI